MKWFKHDSNAHRDAKLKRVKNKYGITGYGLYWYCVELIAGQVDKKNISFELEDDAELIAIEWDLDQLKVEEMMRYFVEIGLFEQENNVITCLKLAKRLDDTNAKNPDVKAILYQLNQDNSETLRETPTNSDQTRLDKTRLDNKKELEEEFEQVWSLYEKKGNRKTSFKRWSSLSQKTKEAINNHLPDYIKSTPDKQFRKNFEGYLNQEAWKDEVVVNHPNNSQPVRRLPEL